jgi:hypothetical protein
MPRGGHRVNANRHVACCVHQRLIACANATPVCGIACRDPTALEKPARDPIPVTKTARATHTIQSRNETEINDAARKRSSRTLHTAREFPRSLVISY